jgi:hypothetical protein
MGDFYGCSGAAVQENIVKYFSGGLQQYCYEKREIRK